MPFIRSNGVSEKPIDVDDCLYDFLSPKLPFPYIPPGAQTMYSSFDSAGMSGQLIPGMIENLDPGSINEHLADIFGTDTSINSNTPLPTDSLESHHDNTGNNHKVNAATVSVAINVEGRSESAVNVGLSVSNSVSNKQLVTSSSSNYSNASTSSPITASTGAASAAVTAVASNGGTINDSPRAAAAAATTAHKQNPVNAVSDKMVRSNEFLPNDGSSSKQQQGLSSSSAGNSLAQPLKPSHYYSFIQRPSWFSKGADLDALLDEADKLDWLTDLGGAVLLDEPAADTDISPLYVNDKWCVRIKY